MNCPTTDCTCRFAWVKIFKKVGTPHGTAAPVFLLGRPVKPGLHGPYPDLTRFDDDGDPRHAIDLRTVYAAVLCAEFSGHFVWVTRTRRLPPTHPSTSPRIRSSPRVTTSSGSCSHNRRLNSSSESGPR